MGDSISIHDPHGVLRASTTSKQLMFENFRESRHESRAGCQPDVVCNVQVFETQQLAALVVEGVAGGGALRLCEINVLRGGGSFRHALKGADTSIVLTVNDAATCHSNFGAAPVVRIRDNDATDNGAITDMCHGTLPGTLRWLETLEEAAICGWLRGMCLSIKRGLVVTCPMATLPCEGWQQRRHRDLAEGYCRQRALLLDLVINALDVQSWLCSSADSNGSW